MSQRLPKRDSESSDDRRGTSRREASLARLLEERNGRIKSEVGTHSTESFLGTTDAHAPATLPVEDVQSERKHRKTKKGRHSKKVVKSEDHDQSEMAELIHQFETSPSRRGRRSMKEASRSDRDLLNAMLGDQTEVSSSTSAPANGSTQQPGASHRTSGTNVFESTVRVGVTHEANNMISYQQASHAIPFATAGVTCHAEVSKEALMMGEALATSGVSSAAPQENVTSEATFNKGLTLTDTATDNGSVPNEPSRLERFLRDISASRRPPKSKETLMNEYVVSTDRSREKGTIVRIPSQPSVLTIETQGRSDLEAGQPEIDMANHRLTSSSATQSRNGSPSTSRSSSPIRPLSEHTNHSEGTATGRRSSVRNFPRADRPGAVPMEGRAFGLTSLWPQYSRRQIMADDMRGSAATGSTFSLVSFFSDGFESVVQATAVEDYSVVMADVVSVKRISRKCKILVCIALSLLLVLAGAILVIFAGSSSGSNTDSRESGPTASPSPMPTVQLDELVAVLSELSSVDDLMTIGTPQHSASFWLANQDKLNITWTTPASPALIQRYTLLVLYFATQGDGGWRTQGGWLDGFSHECEWGPSIACVKSKDVVSLDLSRNSLHGKIPRELKHLSHLEGLHLSENNLSGRLPDTIADITTLHMLRLNDNKLTGSLPMFGDLLALSSLDLSGNHLTGSIDGGVFALEQLRSLDLSFNRLTGTISEKFGNLTFLSKVDLRNNRLEGTIPSELLQIEDIAFLHLDKNQLTGNFPFVYECILRKEKVTVSQNRLSGAIRVMSSESEQQKGTMEGATGSAAIRLRELDFSDNLFSGTVSSNFGELSTLRKVDFSGNLLHGNVPGFPGTNVEHVDFSRNTFDGPLPQMFGTSLTYLDFSQNNLYGTIPSALSDLSGMKLLNLSGNGVSGTLPEALGYINSLRHLNFSNCDITGFIPHEYGELTKLEILDLHGNRLKGHVPRHLDGLHAMHYLDIASNVLTGQLPSQMGRLTELSVLKLSDNEIEGSLPESFSRLMKLETLYLERNRMTGSVPEAICNSLFGLLGDPSQARLGCNMECSCCEDGVVQECEEVKTQQDTSS